MGVNWGLIAVVIGLLLFGMVYNRVVGWMEREGHADGYVAFLVCAGVGATLLAWGLLGQRWNDVLLLLALFMASGLPMILGSMARHMRARARDRAAERADVQKVLRGRTG